MINFKNATSDYWMIIEKKSRVKTWTCVTTNLWDITDANIEDNILNGLWSDVKTNIDHGFFKRYQLLKAFKNL